MTQREAALAGRITSEMASVAEEERIPEKDLLEHIRRGETVILKNPGRRNGRPLGIGRKLRTKVNANVGTSPDSPDAGREIAKARIAVGAGADALMDLSTSGDLEAIRKSLMEAVPVPLGTVPIYEAAVEACRAGGDISDMTADGLFSVLERQAEQGVDFVTVHCGVTRRSLERLKRQGRVMHIVSRGGSFLASWMLAHREENPLYAQFDRVLDIAAAHDVTLSLGDGLRPGSILDATDRAQIEELILLGELTRRAWDRGVQVMIEGPGHVPLDQIESNIRLQKRLCENAPFYVLGPLVTDAAPGYDHITAAIGGAAAAAAGADFLCYVTPGEHLRLPDEDDVRQGVIAARIAGHAGDIVKGVPGALDRDRAMSEARRRLDWEAQIALAIDPERPAAFRQSAPPEQEEVCTMCGSFCAIRLMRDQSASTTPSSFETEGSEP
jgi:phosphomethylpyrimidine synthase